MKNTAKPSLMVAGTGRDGTVSMQHFLSDLFAREGKGRTACHEYVSRECYNRFDTFVQSKDRKEMEALLPLFKDCPYDAIVGNGYAFVLPHLREALPRDMAFIHLRRRDREACIRSLTKHCELFPEAQGHYTPRTDVDIHVWRTAAFHLGEMSKQDWDRLPLRDKFAWYYDRTHALLDEAAGWFPRRMTVYTEDMNDPQCLRAIAEFAGVGAVGELEAVHRNAFTHCDITQLDPFYVSKAQWLYIPFDFKKSVADNAYPTDFFCERFVSWQSYMLSDAPKGEFGKYQPSREEILAEIDREIAVLEKWTRSLRLLRAAYPMLSLDRKAARRFPALRLLVRR